MILEQMNQQIDPNNIQYENVLMIHPPNIEDNYTKDDFITNVKMLQENRNKFGEKKPLLDNNNDLEKNPKFT